MLKISYDTYAKVWLLWRPGRGIVSTHLTRPEAEAAKQKLEQETSSLQAGRAE
jgi:hypothetical protein